MRGDRPWLVFGTMGADGQAQTQLQILTHLIDHRLDLRSAIEAPRWLHGRFLIGDRDDVLLLERPIEASAGTDLRALGHSVRVAPPWDETMGHAQAVAIDHGNGMFEGAADPRGDGLALGY
jgi:gamma-glutamyltranspeptidase/glutathione hydrolase